MAVVLMNPLMLNLEPLGPYLKTVHLIDGVLGRYHRIVRDKTESLRFTSMPIYVNLGGYYVPELIERGGQVCVC